MLWKGALLPDLLFLKSLGLIVDELLINDSVACTKWNFGFQMEFKCLYKMEMESVLMIHQHPE